MATQLQSRRGTTAQMNAFTGAEGEIAVNTSTDTLHVHDGSTAGGHALAKADGSNIATYAGSFTTISASGAITGNVTGNLTGNVTGNITGSVLTAAQTNITSVGTLSALTVSGALTANGGAVFNEASADVDFRVESDGNANMLFVDGGTNNVGLGLVPTSFANRTSLDIGLGGKIWGHTAATETGHGSNFYFDGAYKRIAAVAPTRHVQNNDGHTFSVAASGAADSTITWDDALIVSPSGSLLINSSATADTGGIKLFSNSGVNALPATSGTTQTGGALRLRGANNAVLDMGLNSVYTWIQATDKANLANGYSLSLNPNGGNVGIGISSPAHVLHVDASSTSTLVTIHNTNGSSSDCRGLDVETSTTGTTVQRWLNAGSELGRFTATGNLLVGGTQSNPTGANVAGASVDASGEGNFSVDGAEALRVNRLTSGGAIVKFMKAGQFVGSINVVSTGGGSIIIGNDSSGIMFRGDLTTSAFIPANPATNVQVDNGLDVGHSAIRFDDIYATNPTIQTSDRNEKQDIETLSDAEQRVAVACKGLLRKFRWIDSVETKGDDARIHFGIIAQDLQDAFTAEGLDAGRYAMFISSTWWETQTEVAAVEATEDAEAVDAYTRTDTYHTAEEAPEGSTERTRLGIRSSELLAFIIAAI